MTAFCWFAVFRRAPRLPEDGFLLATPGVDEVLVNTHHLADQVHAHVAARRTAPDVRIAHEPVLLGSAGTLRANREWVAREPMFLAVNADNLTDFDLGALVDAHRRAAPIATLTVFRAPAPSQCGIVELAADGRVVGFVEKPADPPGDLANAGMYAFSPDVLDEIAGAPPVDIGYDLLPRLVGRAHAVPVGDAYFLDIGTPAALASARNGWGRELP